MVGLISHFYVTNLSILVIASANAYFSNSISASINGDIFIVFTNSSHYSSYYFVLYVSLLIFFFFNPKIEDIPKVPNKLDDLFCYFFYFI